MEENKQGKFDKIDELLKDTSAENRIKFNSADSSAEKIITEDSDITRSGRSSGSRRSDP